MTIPQAADATRAAQLDELLLRWQEGRQQGRLGPADELCADCPELVEDLRRRIAALEAMEAVLGLRGDPEPAPGPLDLSTSHDTESPAAPAGPAVSLPGYEILGVLNQGGMGIVYKARQVRPNRLVAVKMILSGTQARPEQLARFRREVEVVARLAHPNVVPIYEVGDHAGQPYFTMEFVAGGSLAQKLAGAVLPAAQAAALLETLARAVHFAHQHGIIHRDLKPGNILLQGIHHKDPKDTKDSKEAEKGQPKGKPGFGPSGPWCPLCLCGESFLPKITDFGLAKELHGDDGQTHSGAILGTPSYLAPEQAAGRTRTLGPAVDVYALGAILYECLTGRPPFRGESTLDTLEQVRQREPVPPSQLRPKCPRDLEVICLKCLRKEPARRYATALELADDLERFLDGRPILARAVGPGEKVLRWAKRQPAAAALVLVSGAAAVALLAAWVGFTAQLQVERDRAHEQERIARQQWAIARRDEAEAKRQRDEANTQRERAQAILARCLAAVDEHAQATENAKAEVRQTGEPGSILFGLARFYAVTSEMYRHDTVLTSADRELLAEQYASRAVKLLERAWQSRYFENPRNLDKLKTEKDLNPLRGRPDFKRLRTQLGG
jgi:serine/threonine protein kinase